MSSLLLRLTPPSPFASQMSSLLLLDDKAADTKRYQALEKWNKQLGALQQTIYNKLS
jgi:hypothetical protein